MLSLDSAWNTSVQYSSCGWKHAFSHSVYQSQFISINFFFCSYLLVCWLREMSKKRNTEVNCSKNQWNKYKINTNRSERSGFWTRASERETIESICSISPGAQKVSVVRSEKELNESERTRNSEGNFRFLCLSVRFVIRFGRNTRRIRRQIQQKTIESIRKNRWMNAHAERRRE